jgi:hypothetical protein
LGRGPFIHGLRIAFTASFAMCVIAAAASWLRGGKYVHREDVGPFGTPAYEGAAPTRDRCPRSTCPDDRVPHRRDRGLNDELRRDMRTRLDRMHRFLRDLDEKAERYRGRLAETEAVATST